MKEKKVKKDTNIKNDKKSELKIKNDNKQTKSKFWDNSNELKKLVTIFVVVVVIFAIFYVLTVVIKNNKSSQPKENNSVAVIQYDEILVGEILNQNQDAYYVLATEEDDNNISQYQSYIDNYKSNENSLKVYEVNLSSVFNKKYMSENSDFDFNQLSEIKFSTATLLKIEDGKLTEYYEGKEEITEYLEDLIA